MSIEINFLEREPKKNINLLLYGILFVLLLACVVTVLFYQKYHYAEKIEIQNQKLVQFENALREHQVQNADAQHLQKAAQNISFIRSGSTPNVILYNFMLDLLATSDQLISYENIGSDQVIVEAEFNTLQDVAIYVSALLEQKFIADTLLTNVSKFESVYQATLTIDLNGNILVEELGNDD